MSSVSALDSYTQVIVYFVCGRAKTVQEKLFQPQISKHTATSTLDILSFQWSITIFTLSSVICISTMMYMYM